MHNLLHWHAGHFGHGGALPGFLLAISAVVAVGFVVAVVIDKSK